MTYAPINISDRFPPGTIGHDREYNPVLAENTNFLLNEEYSGYKPISKKSIGKKEKAVLDTFAEIENPNPDEILRHLGFPLIEKMPCILRKRE